MQDSDIDDKRAKRSKEAIRTAFFDLVLRERYDAISASDIIEKSGVARSTFYEHYPNKEAVLACSLRGPMSVFAETIGDQSKPDKLEGILQHFWEQRSFARLIFSQAPKKSLSGILKALLQKQLVVRQTLSGKKLLISDAHAAAQLAESQLALLTTWLLGETCCDAKTLAKAMHDSSAAIVKSLELEPEVEG